MNGEHVATWTVTRGSHTLVYEDSWLASPRRRPLSLSLPLTADRGLSGAPVAHFFHNLLPDSLDIRRRIGQRLGVCSDDDFELLSAIGRDCIGAVQLLPPDGPPQGWDRVEAEPLTDIQVEQHLQAVNATRMPAELGLHDDAWRISLAGAQEKTALLKLGDQWYLPHGATPSTHILKLPLGLIGNQRANMQDSVYNEWLCLTLLRELGLPAAACEVQTFGSQTVLCVERFDRQWQLNHRGQPWIVRLPQEDFCQALGLSPDEKYEVTDRKGRTTGPTLDALLRVLHAGAEPEGDVAQLLLAQLMFWVLGNTDGHGKNFSLFLYPNNQRYALTPLYDVISLWPIVGNAPSQMQAKSMSLAIALRTPKAKRKLQDIDGADWAAVARLSGVPGLQTRMLTLLGALPAALGRVAAQAPPGFPQRLWDTIVPRVLAQAVVAAEGLAD